VKIIDNRGLNCPEPVLRTKKAFSENPDGVISIVDNEAARENVIRMAKKEGFSTRWEEKGGAYHIYITAGRRIRQRKRRRRHLPPAAAPPKRAPLSSSAPISWVMAARSWAACSCATFSTP